MKEVMDKSAGVMLEERLEAIPIGVSDVDRAKLFYEKLGWRLDIDYVSPDGKFRAVQFTPPGSQCSIQMGVGITKAQPGSIQGLLLVVKDIDAARADIAARGVNIGEVYHLALGEGRGPGRDPKHRSYASYADFNDPDGNGWRLQEITERLPGR